jgi:hypothetical protein
MVAMYWFGYRMEPHWVSKDTNRFMTNAQVIEGHGQAGRRMEVRATFTDDGHVLIGRRRVLKSDPAVYRVTAKSPQPPKGKAIYLLERVPKPDDGSLLMLRMPASSPVIARMDAANARTNAAPPPAEG